MSKAKTKSKPKAKSKATVKKSDKDLLQDYTMMMIIRRFEERAAQLYGMGIIGGFCHLYIGQEAVVVGIQSVINQKKDTVITAYRDHGHMLACGMDPKRVMAELAGRRAGYSKGKGGSMHMFSRESNFYGGHGIVGAQVPLGTGIGFAHKYRDDGGLAVTYMGDGAVNQGQVYEAFNMASLWKLPVIYIIENNQYGMGTSVKRAAANPDLHLRGQAYNIPSLQTDGMDILKVQEAGRKAVQHVRSGKGPFILEILTYRYRGHSMSDPGKYRSKEEVESMRKEHDPINGLGQYLIKHKLATEDKLKEIDKKARQTAIDAAEFAQNNPEPEEHELYTDILVEEVA